MSDESRNARMPEFIEEHAKRGAGFTFFDAPCGELTRDELLAVISVLAVQCESQKRAAKAAMEFSDFARNARSRL